VPHFIFFGSRSQYIEFGSLQLNFSFFVQFLRYFGNDWPMRLPQSGVSEHCCAGRGLMVAVEESRPTYKNKFGEPLTSFIAFFVARVFNFCSVSFGAIAGSSSRSKATAPETCGVAIDVPEIVFSALSFCQ
jgi:hypothetical protein